MALSQVGLERLNTATTKKIGTNKNIIINGAMQVAQRGTSGDATGFLLDRFLASKEGTDETPTQAQADVASGTTPYTSGFRKSLKVTNGNQTSGAGAGDRIFIQTKLEAQDIANSGWNYKSASSFITLSFWVKSSVAQNFHGDLRTFDGTAQGFAFETGSLTADTWTKITKTIPGNSNLQFDNNNDSGLTIVFGIYHGTNFTDAGVTLNQWGTYNGNQRMPTNTTTWYTTNDATFEITGAQLEVGSVVTDFEFRSFAEELTLCQRYYYKHFANNNEFFRGMGMADVDGNSIELNSPFPTTMRVAPSALEQTGNASDYKIRRSTTATCTSVPSFGHATTDQLQCRFTKSSHGFGDGSAVRCGSGTAGGFLAVSAEL